jgi:hypothetical protein
MRRILFLLISYVFVEASGALQKKRTCPVGREAPIPPPATYITGDFRYKDSCQTLKYLNASGANGTATLVADGSACVYTSTLETCNLSQFAQVEFDVEISGNCSEDEWLRAYFFYPEQKNETQTMQFMETDFTFYRYSNGHVFTNFGQDNEGFSSIWGDGEVPLSYRSGLKRHVTTWTSPNDEYMFVNVFVKTCACGSGTCGSGPIKKLAARSVGSNYSNLIGAVAWHRESSTKRPGLFVLDNWGTGGSYLNGSTSAGCALSVTNSSISTCGSIGQPSCANNFSLSPIAGATFDGQGLSFSVVDVIGTCVTPRPWRLLSFLFSLLAWLSTYWGTGL